jgi:hypothetical protein
MGFLNELSDNLCRMLMRSVQKRRRRLDRRPAISYEFCVAFVGGLEKGLNG